MRISDWISDVCSADLGGLIPCERGRLVLLNRDGIAAALPETEVPALPFMAGYALGCADIGRTRAWLEGQGLACADTGRGAIRVAPPAAPGGTLVRSETRRVGNECVSTCRSRLSQSH